MIDIDHHPYAPDGVYDHNGEDRCRICKLGRNQGRAAQAHSTPEDRAAAQFTARILGEDDDTDEPPAIPAQRAPAISKRPRVGLIWGGNVYPPKPCVDGCGENTILHDPATGKPRHKVCAEFDLGRRYPEAASR